MTIKIPVQKEYGWFFNSGDKIIEADTFEEAVELFWQQPENINVSPDYLPSYVHPLEKKFVEIDNKHVPVQGINQENSGEFVEVDGMRFPVTKEMFFGFNKDHETVEGVDYSKVVGLYTELYGHDPLPGVVYPIEKGFITIEDSELA
jgi:hypothetical protein